MLDNVAVVGTGLIGASAALAARREGASVRGWDPDPDVLRVAHERGAVDPAATLADAVSGAALVVIAAPVAELPHVVREVLALAPEGSVVTDVGSTKSAVCAAAAGDGRFVGGHPICGAETRGPERANAELFEGATWFLTPTAGTGPELLRDRARVRDLASGRARSRSTQGRTTGSSRSRATCPTRSRMSCSTRRVRRASTVTTRCRLRAAPSAT